MPENTINTHLNEIFAVKLNNIIIPPLSRSNWYLTVLPEGLTLVEAILGRRGTDPDIRNKQIFSFISTTTGPKTLTFHQEFYSGMGNLRTYDLDFIVNVNNKRNMEDRTYTVSHCASYPGVVVVPA